MRPRWALAHPRDSSTWSGDDFDITSPNRRWRQAATSVVRARSWNEKKGIRSQQPGVEFGKPAFRTIPGTPAFCRPLSTHGLDPGWIVTRARQTLVLTIRTPVVIRVRRRGQAGIPVLRVLPPVTEEIVPRSQRQRFYVSFRVFGVFRGFSLMIPTKGPPP